LIPFLVIKYLSLALTATRSLLLAAVLGPPSFGLLGTLVIVQQNLSYAALGMRESLTVRLAKPFAPGEAREHVINSALIWGAVTGTAIVAAIMLVDRYLRPLGVAWLWVGIIASLSILNEMLINIHRDLGKLAKVAVLELVYNTSLLACVMYFGRSVTVELVLQAMAAGLLASVASFLWSIRADLGLAFFRRALIVRLIGLGLPMAAASLFSASISSVYVLVASHAYHGAVVGQIAFANSMCMMVLFGSNMVAWAATSQSMKGLAVASANAAELRKLRLGRFFQVAVAASAFAIVLSHFALARWLPAYMGAERYALYFCLLQGTSLLLYNELNFLAVHGKSLAVAGGYGAILGITLLTYLLVPSLGIVDLVTLGVALSSIAGWACIRYCTWLGLKSPIGTRSRLVFLAFPTLCAAATTAWGPAGSAALAGLYLAAAVTSLRGNQS
jgi:hypothetical protein